MTRRVALTGLVLMLMLALIHVVRPAEAGPAVPEGAVEAVVSGVLGGGAVRLAFVTARGQVVLRWESPAYSLSDDEGRARAALRSEAARVTGELLSTFSWISAIHFTITHHGSVLATGEHVRGKTIMIFFSSLLAL